VSVSTIIYVRGCIDIVKLNTSKVSFFDVRLMTGTSYIRQPRAHMSAVES
jgi:hypothetical protein